MQAAVIQQDWRASASQVDVRSYELPTFFTDVLRGNFRCTRCSGSASPIPDMLRRVFHSAQVPPAGFNRVLLQQPGGRSADRAAAARSTRRAPGVLYAHAQRLIAEDVPYISLWHKTNVAVFQPEITRRPTLAHRRLHVPQGSFAGWAGRGG